MAVTVAEMIAKVRIKSALRNNPLYSDDQIADLLTDAYADLRDRVNARFAFWFRAAVEFTLAGGNDGFTFDLSTIPDFQEAQYLNWVSGGVKYDVPLLSSVQDRNRYQAGPWNGTRRHFIDGDQLEVLPPTNAAGSYELVYTPQYSALAEPGTRSFAIDPAAQTLASGPDSGFNFANAAFTDADIGATMNVAFDAPNDGLNGDYVISGIHPGSTTWCFVVGGVTPFAVTGTPTGDVGLLFQPAGTISSLPASLSPWALYLVLHAAVAVRTGRKQDTSTLDTQLAVQLRRLVTATKQRGQGVTQAPIARRGYGLNYQGWGRSS